MNGLNQPPAVPRIIRYEETPAATRLITEVDWRSPAVLPDSKTRVEWDEEAYRDVVFRRSVQVTENLLIDRWDVENPHAQCVDAIYLIRGEYQPDRPQTGISLCYPYVHQATQMPLNGQTDLRYQADKPVTISCFSLSNAHIIQAKGPDNPSTSELDYLIMRSHDTRVCWVFVTDLSGKSEVDIESCEGQIIVTDKGLQREYQA